jgi:uncharacterized cysteine cluster protein YcgN (CxxCxxCC family)
MIAEVSVSQGIIILRCAWDCIGYLMRIQEDQIMLLSTHKVQSLGWLPSNYAHVMLKLEHLRYWPEILLVDLVQA